MTNINSELVLKETGLTAWDWTYDLGSSIYLYYGQFNSAVIETVQPGVMGRLSIGHVN